MGRKISRVVACEALHIEHMYEIAGVAEVASASSWEIELASGDIEMNGSTHTVNDAAAQTPQTVCRSTVVAAID